MTDVWVEPELQGKGLGGWLVDCVQEVVESMPHLRRSMLFTGNWEKSVPFYKRRMGMDVMESQEGKGLAIMVRNGRGTRATWRNLRKQMAHIEVYEMTEMRLQ